MYIILLAKTITSMFRKSKNNHLELPAKNESLFQEIVKETMELYEDLKSEYETIENVIAEFSDLTNELSPNLNDPDRLKLEEFIVRLQKVNTYTQNSVRDVRDLLRYQKKILSEIKRGQ